MSYGPYPWYQPRPNTSRKIAQQTQATYLQYQKIEQFDNVGWFLVPYVVSGGFVTKNIKHNDRIDISETEFVLNDSLQKRETVEGIKLKNANSTYFVDLYQGDYWVETAHPPGAVGTDYLTLATVTTDEVGNVNVITDTAGVRGGFRLKSEYGLSGYLRPIVNALDYGVKGDGVTDDTVALQNTLNAATNGIAFIPDGTFMISSTLNVPQNVEIYGAGINGTFIIWDVNDPIITANSTMMVFERNDADNWSRVCNLTLNQMRSERGIDHEEQTQGGIVASDNMIIQNVRIHNTIGPGITQASIENIFIYNCDVYDTGHHGIYFSTGGTTGEIKNAVIQNNRIGTPAALTGRTLEANLIKIRFENGGDIVENVTIDNNQMGSSINGMGIFISTTTGAESQLRRVSVTNNSMNLEQDTASGMIACMYIGDDSVANNVQVYGNTFVASGIVGSYGLRNLVSNLDDSFNIAIENNNFKNCEIGVDSSASNVIGNTIQFTKYGLVGTQGLAKDNTFVTSTDAAVGIRQATVSMIRNQFIMSGATTIGIDMGNSTNLIVAENTINGAAIGIQRNAKSLTGCIFRENIFISCTANYVGFTNSAVTIQNNQFEHTVTDQSGATANRPTALYVGQRFFDSTLNKPIWWNGTNWVDATGATV